MAHLTVLGVLRALIVWFAVWLGWQHTGWLTNWFDPETSAIRSLLLATMALALVMAASRPEAFASRGWLFGRSCALMPVGRTADLLAGLPDDHALAANYRRILAWLFIAGCVWLAGGWAAAPLRPARWLAAVLCEYVSPMLGFALPGLGRSRTREWTVDGAHLAKRRQQFVIVALGELLLATGAALARAGALEPRRGAGGARGVPGDAGDVVAVFRHFEPRCHGRDRALEGSGAHGRAPARHARHADRLDHCCGGGERCGAGAALRHAAARAGRRARGRAVCKRVVYGLVPRSSILAAAARVLLAPRAERVDLLTLATLDTAMRLVQWRTGRGAWGGVGRTPRGAGSPAALRPRIAARAPAHKL